MWNMRADFFTKRRNQRAIQICQDLGLDPSEVYEIEQVNERQVQVSFLSRIDSTQRWQKVYDWPLAGTPPLPDWRRSV